MIGDYVSAARSAAGKAGAIAKVRRDRRAGFQRGSNCGRNEDPDYCTILPNTTSSRQNVLFNPIAAVDGVCQKPTTA